MIIIKITNIYYNFSNFDIFFIAGGITSILLSQIYLFICIIMYYYK